MSDSKELVIPNNSEMMSFGDAPDYLKGDERTGLEGLGSKDFKIPRIVTLQAMNPECRAFPGVAIPGNFWHQGANLSLGPKFRMIAGLASKRVILFKPRWEGGGILAFSSDSIKWDSGANKVFTVKPVDKDPKTVQWATGKDVHSSGLAEWGSSNPEVENSPPAAVLIYEYLVYLPDHPGLSPVLLSCAKTALKSAQALNTTYMMLKKPMSTVYINVAAKEITENNNSWFIPSFSGGGWVRDEALFKSVSQMGQMYSTYKADYEDLNAEDVKPNTNTPMKDEIPF